MQDPSVRPTLATVAKLAGVSVASVSRVLNGMPASPEMESRVMDAVTSTGYVPDAFARSLRARRTNQLALAVADVGNPVYVAMMRAIDASLRSTDYRLVLHSTEADLGAELDLLGTMRHGYVDGLILQSLRVGTELLAEITRLTIPTVVIGLLPDQVPVDNVRTDTRLGMRLAVEHLVATGRRRIALVNGPIDTVPGVARWTGFAEAMAAAGLDVETAPIEQCADFTHVAGLEAVRRLLARTEPGAVDAIACSNDLIAMGALRALAERGLRVPDDVAVVGMDDTDLAAMCNPPLSSVSTGAAERGTTAARLLLERIEDPDLPPRRYTVPPRLVVRESTVGGAAAAHTAAPEAQTPAELVGEP
jgi:LacI family transcriptional regulator